MDVKAEIITIGNELITGVQVDTNGPYLAQRLFSEGISVKRIVSVGDGAEAIADALKESIARADLVLITGGLGPTRDDITTEVVTKALGKKLVFYPEALDHIKKVLGSYNVEMTEGQKKQAYFPEGAEIIPNPQGTALGFLIKEGKTLLVFFPGVPRELEAMVEEAILPRLENEWKREAYFQSRTLRLFGISESKVDDRLKDIFENQKEVTLFFLPLFPEINVRITVQGKNNEEACSRLTYWEKAISERLEPYVFGTDNDTMEDVVGNLLRRAKATIAVAESCTGGLIGHRLTNIPGSSDYVERVAVVYNNQAKMDLLKVPEDVIRTHGAVSELTAKLMAEGIRNLAGTTLGLSTTGIAGPAGGSPDKPVGTVFISLSDGQETSTKKYHFPGDRQQIKLMTSAVALNRIKQYFLKKNHMVV
ncbi:MAG: competence/damage-inducible protein [Deltaproteobacteria bacterium]|nr:competence/damage-inducible protein [Deltaproteobacteria bacterium]